MRITDIQQQKNNEERFSIFIDDEFKFGMSGMDVLSFKLKIGDEISEDRYNYILDNVIFMKAKDKALRYLGYKARTEKELIDKLKTYDYSEEIIFRVLKLLKEYNYINDEVFTESYIRDRIKLKGIGKFKIRYELKEKGVSEDIIEQSLESMPYDEIESAIKHINKKVKGLLDTKERKRIYAYLLRKGFSYEVIKQAFETIDISEK